MPGRVDTPLANPFADPEDCEAGSVSEDSSIPEYTSHEIERCLLRIAQNKQTPEDIKFISAKIYAEGHSEGYREGYRKGYSKARHETATVLEEATDSGIADAFDQGWDDGTEFMLVTKGRLKREAREKEREDRIRRGEVEKPDGTWEYMDPTLLEDAQKGWAKLRGLGKRMRGKGKAKASNEWAGAVVEMEKLQ